MARTMVPLAVAPSSDSPSSPAPHRRRRAIRGTRTDGSDGRGSPGDSSTAIVSDGIVRGMLPMLLLVAAAVVGASASTPPPSWPGMVGGAGPVASNGAAPGSGSSNGSGVIGNGGAGKAGDGSKGGWFGGILRGGKGEDEKDEAKAPQNGPPNNILPPPPPPPPPPEASRDDTASASSSSTPPVPPPQKEGPSSFWDEATPPPPPGFQPWDPQSQYQYQQPPQQSQQQPQKSQQSQQETAPYFDANAVIPSHTNWNAMQPPPMQMEYEQAPYIDPESYQSLLGELDESTLREMTLSHQVLNLTDLVSNLSSESNSLLIRVDSLSERLADSESDASHQRNRRLESEANCTELTEVVERLEKELSEREAALADATEAREVDGRAVAELRSELRKVTDELESLACLVETDRFESERRKYLNELRKRKMKKKERGVGFWSWLFGIESGGKMEEWDDEEERDRAAQELARSSLLHALQSERDNVDELEAALSTLQQNNTAIMDVVKSRDSLVDELNARVDVFEEDKMVLKAALRQLQKEIKEEAPKTQALAVELEEARARGEAVVEELEETMEAHAEEIVDLREEVERKEEETAKTRSELELIGVYVDQLEDRLAQFAIARRDIEQRELKCAGLEESAECNAEEAARLRKSLDEAEAELKDTNPLLEELVGERASNRKMVQELTDKAQKLSQQINEWKVRLAEAERAREELIGKHSRELFLKVEEEKAAWESNHVRTMEETRKGWESESVQQLEQTLDREKASWQGSAAVEWEERLLREKASIQESMSREMDVRLGEETTALRTRLTEEWNARLLQEQSEFRREAEEEVRRRIEDARNMFDQEKADEISRVLSEEKAVWEAAQIADRIAAKEADDAAFAEEVERASAKVFERLEANGFSFGSEEATDAVTLGVLEQQMKNVDDADAKDDSFEDTPDRTYEDDVRLEDDGLSFGSDEAPLEDTAGVLEQREIIDDSEEKGDALEDEPDRTYEDDVRNVEENHEDFSLPIETGESFADSSEVQIEESNGESSAENDQTIFNSDMVETSYESEVEEEGGYVEEDEHEGDGLALKTSTDNDLNTDLDSIPEVLSSGVTSDSTEEVCTDITHTNGAMNGTLSTGTRTVKRPLRRPPSRSVPFRPLRKAFARITGKHGVLTPSTVQLRIMRSKHSQRMAMLARSEGGESQGEASTGGSNGDDTESKGLPDVPESEPVSGLPPPMMPPQPDEYWSDEDSFHEGSSNDALPPRDEEAGGNFDPPPLPPPLPGGEYR